MTTAAMIRNQESAGREASVNVGETERMASKVGGGVLAGVGLIRGGWTGLALIGLGAALYSRGKTGYCSLYQAIGANTAEDYEPGPSDSVPAQAGVRVEESVTIERSSDDLYAFWRDYSNLSKFMADIESVTSTAPGGRTSHWVAKGPMGAKVEWDAELINDEPGRVIAWRSTGGEVDTAGSVHFDPAPGGRGTVVRVNQKVNPPAGKLGVAVAKIFGQDPATLTRENLRRFKMLMEIGEIATTSGQATGGA